MLIYYKHKNIYLDDIPDSSLYKLVRTTCNGATEYWDFNLNIAMAYIPPGRYRNKTTEYRLKKPFYMGKYPITQAEWRAIMKYNPSRNKGDLYPIENINVEEMVEFITRLNNYTNRKYRLPTTKE
jgi:hypothetical protein